MGKDQLSPHSKKFLVKFLNSFILFNTKNFFLYKSLDCLIPFFYHQLNIYFKSVLLHKTNSNDFQASKQNALNICFTYQQIQTMIYLLIHNYSIFQHLINSYYKLVAAT